MVGRDGSSLDRWKHYVRRHDAAGGEANERRRTSRIQQSLCFQRFLGFVYDVNYAARKCKVITVSFVCFQGCWDPTGRYFVTCATTQGRVGADHGFRIYTFQVRFFNNLNLSFFLRSLSNMFVVKNVHGGVAQNFCCCKFAENLETIHKRVKKFVV